MTNKSPLSNDENIWDELLNSEPSKQLLDKLIEQAKEEIKEQKK